MTVAAVATHSKLYWYVMRGSGLVSLVLLTATVAMGIAGVRRWSTRGLSRAVLALVHKNVALLSVAFLGVHIATAVTDAYIKVPWYSSLLPGTSGYRTVATALGTVAIDLFLAVIVTSLLRARISRRLWKAVHFTAYAAWPVALLHGVTDGTDTGTWWTTALYLLSGLAMVAAIAWRLAAPRRSRPRSGPPAGPSTTPRTDAAVAGRRDAGTRVLVSSATR